MKKEIRDGLENRFSYARTLKLDTAKTQFKTPVYVPSFSSKDDPFIKNRLENVLSDIPQKAVLISAYDYQDLKDQTTSQRQNISDLIKVSFKHKVMYLDSGGYELQYRKEKSKWDQKKYIKVIKEVQPDIVVNFDSVPNYFKNTNFSNRINESLNFIHRVNGSNLKTLLLHFTPFDDIRNNLKKIFDICENKTDYFDIIGIPDREIGPDIFARAKNISYLREQMKSRNIEKPIHIFGCSNPLSILLYYLSGADMFDGTGWYRYLYMDEEFSQYDKSHLKFFDCDCKICRNIDWTNTPSSLYGSVLIRHNLEFFKKFFAKLREASETNSIDNLLDTFQKPFCHILQKNGKI